MTSKQTEQEKIKQIEKAMAPLIVDKIQGEYRETKKNEKNVTYINTQKESSKMSVVNPSQMQIKKDTEEDTRFITLMEEIKKEIGYVDSLMSEKISTKVREYIQNSFKQMEANLKTLYNQYVAKTPFIRFNKNLYDIFTEFYEALKKVTKELNRLPSANFCSKGRINAQLKRASEEAFAYNTLIKGLLGLESRDIILSSGEIIIEKVVEKEPSEAKIRELISKNIKDFIPKEKPQQPIIQTREEIRFVKTEDQLGRAYQLLYGQKDYIEALKLLRELDDNGDANAQATIGIMFLEGMGVEKNISKAIQYFQKAHASGNLEARYRLAVLLEKGLYKESEDKKSNIIKAIEYYRTAAEEGHAGASIDLAYLLEQGKVVQQNLSLAYDFLQKYAEKKNPRALNNLGVLLLNNAAYFDKKFGDKASDAKALKAFQEAAKQGYYKAYTNLGICYEQERGVEKDMTQALAYYKLGAERGDPDALHHLGYYAMNQAALTNDESKYAEAAEYFREGIAKDSDLVDPLFYLGFLFEHGLGVERDLKTAFRYYKKAADMKHAKALTRVATFYSKGAGMDKPDPQSALYYYELAADLHDEEALNHLGVIYEEGIDVPPDYQKAYGYYKRAADLGNSKAKLNIGLMYELGRLGEKDLAEAARHYIEAAQMGNTQAKFLVSQRNLDHNIKKTLYTSLGMTEYMDTRVTIDAELDEVNPEIREELENRLTNDIGPSVNSEWVRPDELKKPPQSLRTSTNSQTHLQLPIENPAYKKNTGQYVMNQQKSVYA